jgi:hypothetical protein
MGTSVVPQLIDALVARTRAALPNIEVFDGTGVSADPGDFVMIGVEDPDPASTGFSATASQTAGPLGSTKPRDQTGVLWCIAYSWTGDLDQKLARDTAYSYLAAVENLLRADPTLGIAAGGMFVAQMGDTEQLSQKPTKGGVDAALMFNISFFARI